MGILQTLTIEEGREQGHGHKEGTATDDKRRRKCAINNDVMDRKLAPMRRKTFNDINPLVIT